VLPELFIKWRFNSFCSARTQNSQICKNFQIDLQKIYIYSIRFVLFLVFFSVKILVNHRANIRPNAISLLTTLHRPRRPFRLHLLLSIPVRSLRLPQFSPPNLPRPLVRPIGPATRERPLLVSTTVVVPRLLLLRLLSRPIRWCRGSRFVRQPSLRLRGRRVTIRVVPPLRRAVCLHSRSRRVASSIQSTSWPTHSRQ
jgi:hypothetical protein